MAERRRMLRKFWALPAVAAALLAGCGGSSHKAASTVPPAPVTTAPSSVTVAPGTTPSSVTPAPTSTTSSSPSSTAPSGPQPCPTSALTASLGSPSGAAGTVYYKLILTNTGSATCTLTGYPGVSFVTGSSGTQVGAAAARLTGTVSTVTLPTGQSASSNLGITVASNYGSSCQITPVNGLRVYPPGQTAALFVSHTDNGCANSSDVVLHVGPLASGS